MSSPVGMGDGDGAEPEPGSPTASGFKRGQSGHVAGLGHATREAFVNIHGYDPDWSWNRRQLGKVFNSKGFDACFACCILTNMVLLVIETDTEAAGDPPSHWINNINFSLMIVYVIEMILRSHVYRMDFFLSVGNQLDMCIIGTDVIFHVLTSVVDEDKLPSVVILRVFRLCRLGRARKLLVWFPELQVMILGLVGSCRAIFWGSILLVVVIVIWSILAVQLVFPLSQQVLAQGGYADCARCPRAYESVAAAMLTFTQTIIAGDGWGAVALPLIEYAPVMYVFYFSAFITIGMAVLNLILAVVIDSANQARKQTDHDIAVVKAEQFAVARKELLQFCSSLDLDNDGMLTLKELVAGYDNIDEFQDIMKVLDIKAKDMATVFQIMDCDKSGEVDYNEFVDFFFSMRTEDPKATIVMIRHYVTEIQNEMREELESSKLMQKEMKELTTDSQAIIAEVHELFKSGKVHESVLKSLRESLRDNNDVSSLRTSQDNTNPLIQEMSRDFKALLGSLSQFRLARESSSSLSFREMDQVLDRPVFPALPSSLFEQLSSKGQVAVRQDPKAGSTLATYPSSPNMPGLLGCCASESSIAQPPTATISGN